MLPPNRYRVLLVEDNPGDADLIALHLTEVPGYHFDLARVSSLQQARAALEATPFDAVLLDLHLPDSSGIATLRRLRTVRENVAYIVISSIAPIAMRGQMLREGAHEFIHKEDMSRLLVPTTLFAIERQRLHTEQRQIEKIAVANPDAMIVVDYRGVVQFVNAAALTLFGRNREDFVGELLGFSIAEGQTLEIEIVRNDGRRTAEMHIVDIMWDEQPACLASIRDITDRVRAEAEVRTLNAELEQRVIARTNALARSNAALQEEITQRKNLEDQIRREAARANALAGLARALAEAGRDLPILFDTITEHIAALFGDTCVLSLLSTNRQWTHIVAGQSPGTAHSTLSHTLLAKSLERADTGWSALVATTGEALHLTNVPIDEARAQLDPRCHPYLDSLDALNLLIVPLRMHDAPLGTIAVMRDGANQPYTHADHMFLQDLADRAGLAIENARLFAAAEQARAEAERANQAKSAFLMSMSHELRTPLNAILGYTGTMLMRLPGPLTTEQEKHLTIVQQSGKHLLTMINDLLDLAKIEAGKVNLRQEPVHCQESTATVIESLRPLAQQKGIALRLVCPSEPIIVSTDRRLLSQILLNLINNAVKFTDAGEVAVSLARQTNDQEPRAHGATDPSPVVSHSSLVVFAVRDTGIGIRREDHAQLFQEFGQIDSEAVRERGGSGLGLQISQRLAQLLGGQITFESEYSKGSTFVLTLKDI